MYGDLTALAAQKQKAWERVKEKFEACKSLRDMDDDCRAYVWDWIWWAPYGQMTLTQLNDQLFLGSCLEATNTTALLEAGITTICNLTKEDFGSDLTFRYKQFFQNDKEPVSKEVLQEFLEWTDERVATGDKVLIHCQLGISRTPAFAIAWFLHKAGADKDSAHMALWSELEDQVQRCEGLFRCTTC